MNGTEARQTRHIDRRFCLVKPASFSFTQPRFTASETLVMIRKHLVTLAAFASLAAAGTAARADDITLDTSVFMSAKSRAEVCAETELAIAQGAVFASEVDLSPTMQAAKAAGRSRADVRAEVGEASRKFVMLWYPA
jgi:uncharacterized protein YcbX